MKKSITAILYFLVFSLLFLSSLVFRSDLSAGVSFGINYSLKVLIPSLFPLIFLSSLISFSPLAPVLSRAAAPVVRRVFKLPGECFMPIFFGLTCGYPVGAKLTAGLLAKGKITAEQAGRLLLFVINPGIPFAVLFVGGALFGDMVLGFFLFASTATASVIIGILLGLKKPLPPKSTIQGQSGSLMTAVDLAARSSLHATLNMCLYVVIFSAYLPLLHSLGIFQSLLRLFPNPVFTQPEMAALFSFIGDVIHGVSDALTLHVGPHIFALGLAFGGICIHLQAFSCFTEKPVTLPKFYIGRFIHAFFTYGIFSLLMLLFPRTLHVFSSLTSFTTAPFKGTVTGSICLILLALTYIGLSGAKTLWKNQEFHGIMNRKNESE